jgi:hypothetical protein
MDDEPVRTVERPIKPTYRRWLILGGIVVIAFFLGFVPMWLAKRSVANDLDKANRQLRREQLQNSLSAAAVYARRGEYETGRQNASTFFTELQAELDRANSSVLTAQERTQIPAVLSSRDDIITLLSRGDPAAAERLSNLYVDYRSATATPQP